MWTHLTFMPHDPWCCYKHRTGVGRWSSCVLLAGNHPSLRVVILRLLLLSHAWPRFSSVFSLLYVTLNASLLWISPVRLSAPLCLFDTIFHSPVCLQELSLLRFVFLKPAAVLFSSNSYQLYTWSHPNVSSQNTWVTITHFLISIALLYPHMWKRTRDFLPLSLHCIGKPDWSHVPLL